MYFHLVPQSYLYNKFIHKDSFYPLSHKLTPNHSMMNGAVTVISNITDLETELKLLNILVFFKENMRKLSNRRTLKNNHGIHLYQNQR